MTSIAKLKQKLADKAVEREQSPVPDNSQDLFEKDESDDNASKLSSDEDEHENDKPPSTAPPLEETYIVEPKEANTQSQTWFKCDKDGPRCHKRFIAADFDKHNKQFHSDGPVETDEKKDDEKNDDIVEKEHDEIDEKIENGKYRKLIRVY